MLNNSSNKYYIDLYLERRTIYFERNINFNVRSLSKLYINVSRTFLYSNVVGEQRFGDQS